MVVLEVESSADCTPVRQFLQMFLIVDFWSAREFSRPNRRKSQRLRILGNSRRRREKTGMDRWADENCDGRLRSPSQFGSSSCLMCVRSALSTGSDPFDLF